MQLPRRSGKYHLRSFVLEDSLAITTTSIVLMYQGITSGPSTTGTADDLRYEEAASTPCKISRPRIFPDKANFLLRSNVLQCLDISLFDLFECLGRRSLSLYSAILCSSRCCSEHRSRL